MRPRRHRYLLARIPLPDGDGTCLLAKQSTQGSKELHAAQLRANDQGDELTEAVQDDEHLRPFLTILGKDNKFDIEGLAVVDERIFLGLRGPVLGGRAGDSSHRGR